MHCHGRSDDLPQDGHCIALVGNPNVGKSVIFGLLTGRYVVVSNYPGTTVEVTRGTATLNGRQVLVVDTPGTNSLLPMSEDERVTRDILLNERPQAVIQVADAKNLRRSLLLSLQLAEMEMPFVLALNMNDEARSRGIHIDERRLAELLGVEVVTTVATRRQGIGRLVRSVERPRRSPYVVEYDANVEAGVAAITPLLPEDTPRRALALMLLAGDESLTDWLHDHLEPEAIAKIEDTRHEVQSQYNQPLGYIINRRRLRHVDDIVTQVYHAEESTPESLAARLGWLSMHPVWGLPILLLVLLGLYEFVGVFGAGTLVDFFEGIVFGQYLNPWATAAVKFLIPIPFFQELLVGEYGLMTVALTYAIAIVLPIVGTFFIAFGLLEDSGYLPRLAVMVNRIFRLMGLNGKAVLPMVLGLGCDTMATLTSRILETKKERIVVTLLLALAVPCSAQLGVILGMLGGVSLAATLIWAGVVAGVMVLVGWLSSLILPGEPADFMLEVPPIRVPQLSNILIKTAARMEWYLKEAVPLFILGTLVLFAADKLNLLVTLERWAAPVVVGWLDLPAETTQAFIVGFLRRDYGAAGLYALAQAGRLSPRQVVVSLVTMTLFVPCIANFFIIIKERGLKTALAMTGFIFPFAFFVGGVLNWVLRGLGVAL